MAKTDDTGERTISPTKLRLTEARRRGEVPRSSDLTAAILVLGVLAAGAIFVPRLIGDLTQMTAMMLGGDESIAISPGAAGELMWRYVGPVVWTFGQFCLVLAGIAVLANVVQVGVLAATQRIRPDLERISPVTGVRRMFSRRSAFRGVMTAAKIVVVGFIGVATIDSAMGRIVSVGKLDAGQMVSEGELLVMILGVRVGLALLVLALLDYLYQRWQHRQDLKMTRRELLDELRRNKADGRMLSWRGQLASTGGQSIEPISAQRLIAAGDETELSKTDG